MRKFGKTEFAEALGKMRAERRGMVVGQHTFVSPRGKLSIARGGRIECGDHTRLLTGFHLEAYEGATIVIGSRVHCCERLQIVALPGSRVEIADDCWLNHDIAILAREEVKIGNGCLFGPHCYMSDHNHGIARQAPIRSQGYDVAPIAIGPDCWLGIGATVLKGTNIGEGAVIAARAVVNKEVPAFEIWGGLPARRIGVRQ